jgi:hypothetical protein
MPKQTDSPGRATYHSGVFRHNYVLPDIYHDPLWISRWKFDDITTGYALDSKHTNNLRASGSPTQVGGYRQSSGVEFDGVNDCFYLPWASGSGLVGFVPPGIAQNSLLKAHWGIMGSLYVSSFTNDMFIMSKWNEVGNDREWGVGINTSGGLFLQFKKNGTTQSFVSNTSVSGIVPLATWFDFAFGWNGVNSTNTLDGSSVFFIIDDKIVAEAHGDTVEETGASGIFVVGAANWGKTPSGFFHGRMEDIRFYNGKHPSVPNYNAFHSGVAPLTSYPNINDFNPYMGGHFQLNALDSGTVDVIQTGYYAFERKNMQHLGASGANFTVPTRWRLEPGAADGTYGSGYSMSAGNTSMMARPANLIRRDTILPRHSFTVSWWHRSNLANTDDPILFGYQVISAGSNTIGPYHVSLGNRSQQRITLGWEQDSRDEDLTVPASQGSSTGVWVHNAIVVDIEQSRVDIYTSGIWRVTEDITSSGLWLKEPVTQYYKLGWSDLNTAIPGFSGLLDEICIWHYPLPSSQVVSFYSSQSGFVVPAEAPSGNIGGYTTGVDFPANSGMAGGFIISLPYGSGTIGGYVSGVPHYISGMFGGYVRVGPTASGNLGGYLKGKLDQNMYIGAYAAMAGGASGSLGGYLRGVEETDQESSFVAFFNVIGRDKEEFDSQVQIYKSLFSQFDAQAVVFSKEQKPNVSIFNPAIDQSGNAAPVTYTFEAYASGTQGKNIYKTFWFFSDTTSTSGSTQLASGIYKTTHTFANSGLFDVIFVAIDDKGIINSDRRIINTASGATLPTITLGATPESGIVPLSVQFTGTINSAPTQIVDKYIYFGDGTRSASTNSIYKLYPVIGCYIPVFRVRDSLGYIVTDSLVVNANN